jgi:ABC-type oligopeptide transport system substrate-binding subunit
VGRALPLLASIPALAAACAPAPADLVVINGGDAALLDPQLGASMPEARIAGALHAGLTRLDPVSLQPQPDLAESWTSDPAARVWTFLLRPELRWSDGSPLVLQDWLESWERLRAAATGAPYAAWLADAQIRGEIQADGRTVLEVRFPSARPMFAEMAASWPLVPVHRSLRDSPAGTVPAHFISSGPYRLLSRRVRDRVRVEINPHYWQTDAARLGVIDFLAVESQFTALNLFLAGEADFVPNVPRLAVPRLLGEHAQAFRPSPQFAAIFLRLNLRHPLLANRELRLALARSLDRAALAEMIGGGRTSSASLVPALLADYHSLPTPATEDLTAARAHLARAREELAAAGREGANALDGLELLVASTEQNRDLAAALREQWRTRLGLDVRIQVLEGREARAAERAGEYAMARASWVGDYLDPETFLSLFRASDPGNRTGFADPEFEALLSAAAAAAPAARLELLARAEARLLAEAAVIPLLTDANQELLAPDLRGFTPNPRGHVDWSALRRAP